MKLIHNMLAHRKASDGVGSEPGGCKTDELSLNCSRLVKHFLFMKDAEALVPQELVVGNVSRPGTLLKMLHSMLEGDHAKQDE